MRFALLAAVLMATISAPAFAEADGPVNYEVPALKTERAASTMPQFGTVIGTNFRIRSNLAPITEPNQSTLVEGRVHRRLLSSMFDFYPTGSEGFHISGGMLRYSKTPGIRDISGVTQLGLVNASRLGGLKQRNRYTPALTMGYSLSLGKDMMMGLEAGRVFGRMNNQPSMLRMAGLRENSGPGGSSANSIVHMSFGYRF